MVCGCGCGEIPNKGNVYIYQHQLKGKKQTETHRKKGADARRGKPSGMKGKTHTEDARKKMSKAGKGKSKSETHCLSISKGRIGIRFSKMHRMNISKSKQGKNHPMYGKQGHNSGKKIHSEEHKQLLSIKMSSEGNHNWKGGVSKEPYSFDFNNSLKYKIRKRDNFTCQECDSTEILLKHTLHIHHIDYDKMNNLESNLISLCNSCHPKTNFDRKYWVDYFRKSSRI